MRLLETSRPMWPIWLAMSVAKRDTCKRTAQTESKEGEIRGRVVVPWIIKEPHIKLAMRVATDPNRACPYLTYNYTRDYQWNGAARQTSDENDRN